MRNKLITASGSLVFGLALIFMANKINPTASADTLALDQTALARFQIVMVAGIILIVVSFILFIYAAVSKPDKD